MKLTALLIILFCLHLSAATYAQITLSENNASLSKVFRDIRKQSNYQFFYREELLTNTKKVNASVNNVSLNQALDICLKDQPLTYSIVGNTVVIKEKQAVPKNNKLISTNIDVTGRVLDEKNQPISGATVQIKNGKQVTITDEKGYFTLRGATSNAIIVITVIGFEKQELAASSNMGDIHMKVANSKLDEVTVIAYGTTTQRLNTGDVTTVKSATIDMQPVSNPILALEGRVPGLFITQTSGLPGSASSVQVQIRGPNSLFHQGDPLYIVDGVPYVSQTLPNSQETTIFNSTSGDPLNFINPGDIESITVLKDAGATAIYGSRGANGVILITTKKGKDANTKVVVNAQDGFGQVAHMMKLLSLSQYLAMRNEAFRNDNATPNPNSDYDLTLWDTTKSTNWQKELLGGSAQYKDWEGSISGGSGNTQYLVSGAYHYETTVFPANWNDKKASFHFSLNSSGFKDKLKLFLSINYVVDENDVGAMDPTATALELPPDAPNPKNPDGTLNWAPTASGASSWPFATNPLAIFLVKNNANTNNFIGNLGITYNILPQLQFKTSLGYTHMENNVFFDGPFSAVDPAVWATDQRFSTFTNNTIDSWIVEPQLTYNTHISKGLTTVLIGSTFEQNLSQGQSVYAQGFGSDQLLGNITDATSITPLNSPYELYRYSAVFGRLNYNWSDKYLLDLVIRRDGSSRFGPDNRFANFYSVGGAWLFSNNVFFQKNIPALSSGKLRFSYGTTGNDQVGAYSYLDLYNNIPNIGNDYQGAAGLKPTSIYTPNLKWELTRKMEFGLETGFFKDRILFSGSYYIDRSSNQLVGYDLPSITGFTQVEQNIPAVIQNTGLEGELSVTILKQKNFSWVTSFNISSNRNELAKTAPGLGAYYNKLVGHPIDEQFLYHFAGVDPITGVNLFTNSKGNTVTQPNSSTDNFAMLNTDPVYYGGFENSIIFKRFQLDFLFQFVKRKNLEYLYYGMPGAEYNQPVSVLAAWQKPGDVTSIEKFSQNGSLAPTTIDATQSDQAFVNGSYIRLKNVSLSYALSNQWLHRLHMQNAKIFVHGQNLLTFTHYLGMDPESLSTNSGVSLPPLRVITTGINASF